MSWRAGGRKHRDGLAIETAFPRQKIAVYQDEAWFLLFDPRTRSRHFPTHLVQVTGAASLAQRINQPQPRPIG
jgi:hypothetical protein